MIFLVLGTGSSYNMEMQQFFSNEFLICTEIYRYNTREGGGEKIVWFNKLADYLKESVPQATVSKCLDYLFDKGMVDADWKRNPDTDIGQGLSGRRRIYEIH